MTNRLSALLVIMALQWSGSANAALMPPVSVDGREWLQPVDFINTSWADIASVCDNATGVCNGSLGGNILTGWTWASVFDMYELFTSMGIPGLTPPYTNEDIELDLSGNSVWAPAFLSSFLPTATGDGTAATSGYLRNPLNVSQAYLGTVADNVLLPRIFVVADLAQTTAFVDDIDNSYETIGGWFYRAEVPSPATIPLLCSALAALFLTRRGRTISA